MNTPLITRSRRKTIGLYVTETGLEVRAPLRAPQNAIDAFIASKKNWIDKKLAQVQKLQAQFPKLTYQTGDTIYVLGNKLSLVVEKNKLIFVQVKADTLIITCPKPTPALVRKHLIAWFTRQAEGLIAERIPQFKSKISHKKTTLTIKTLTSRWGSCSSTGKLTFNWALIMGPLFVVDYVIVHELCHLLEMNHSRKFWAHVGHHFPDYKKAMAWLKKHGLGLGLP